MTGSDESINIAGQEIWLDRVARIFGFGRIADHIEYQADPAFLFIGFFMTIDFLLQLTKELEGETAAFIENPFWILIRGVLIIAVFGTKQLHSAYNNAKIRLQIDNRLKNPDTFSTLGSDRLRWGSFILGAAVHMVNIILIVGLPTVYRVDGISGLVLNLILNPLIYAPIAIDFLVTYFAVQVLLPRRIERSDLGLDYLDPENMGGLRPIGELLKRSYYYIVIGFVSFALFTYAPFVFPDYLYAPYEPGPIVNGIYTIGWVGSAAMLAYGLYVLHRFMHREKRQELIRLDQEVKNKIEEPWDVQNFKIPDEREADYKDIRTRMEHVSSTREYPATFTMWSQLLISIIIPKALQMVLNAA